MGKMNKKQSIILVLLSFSLYISLGLPDSLIGSGWPVIRQDFHFSLELISVITTVQLLFSLLSNALYIKISTKVSEGSVIFLSMFSILISLFLMLFAPNGIIFLISIPFLGLGQGAIDVAVNTIVARRFSEKIMNFVHAFYGLGVTLSSIFEAISIRYTSTFRLAILLVLILHSIILIFFMTKRATFTEHGEVDKKKKKSKLKFTLANWLFPIFYFLYAIEQIFSIYMASFLVFQHFDAAFSALITGIFWFSLMCGRIVSGFLLDYLESEKLILILLFISFIGTLLMWFSPLFSAILIGGGFSGLYPTIMTLAHRYFNIEKANRIVALNVTAAGLGMFVMPLLFSALIASFNLLIFPWLFEIFFILLAITGIFMLRLNVKEV